LLLLGLATVVVGVVLKQLPPRWPTLLITLVLEPAGVAVAINVAMCHRVSAFVGRLPPFSGCHWTWIDPALAAQRRGGGCSGWSPACRLPARCPHVRSSCSMPIRKSAPKVVEHCRGVFSGSLSAGSFTRSGLIRRGCLLAAGRVFGDLGGAVRDFRRRADFAHPIPAMAGSILRLGLVDHRGIRSLLRVSRAEFVVMALTCLATLLLELQTAIYAGVLASLFFYLKRTSQPRVQHWREGDEDAAGRLDLFAPAITCKCACNGCTARGW
jgi:SulP family sulfate permease